MSQTNHIARKRNSYIRGVSELVGYVQGLVDDSVFIKDWREHADLEEEEAYIELVLSDKVDPKDIISALSEELRQSNMNLNIEYYEGSSIYVKPSFHRDIIEYYKD